ncbi:MAG: hypothetical protein KGH53_01015 [Candidatus Micrarchaeota archaeon]|nr:hypothetical protein [Candidatus Micrarchaeota archaeon]
MKGEFSELVRHDESSCPECKGSLMEDIERGESVCIKCGYISAEKLPEQHIDLSPDYDSRKDQNKGRSPAIAPFGKSGMIGSENKDFSGKSISPEVKQLINRMRIWDNRFGTSTTIEKNLRDAAPLITSWCEELGLPEQAKARALTIYIKATKEKLARGRSINNLAAGAILASCRIDQIPRTAKQISKVTGIPGKAILRASVLIRTRLDLTNTAQAPINYLPLISSRLGLPETVSRETCRIIEQADSKSLWDGKDPLSLVSAAIYISATRAGINLTQKQIRQAGGKGEFTTRRCARELSEKLGLDYKVPGRVKVRG